MLRFLDSGFPSIVMETFFFDLGRGLVILDKKNVKMEIRSMDGKLLETQTIDLRQGENQIYVEVPFSLPPVSVLSLINGTTIEQIQLIKL